MKLLISRKHTTVCGQFVFLNHSPEHSPDASPEVTPDQVQARGEILQQLVHEINLARSDYFEGDNFVETDDPQTQGIHIQEGASDFRTEALARDPYANPNQVSRSNVKQPGEIIVDRTNGIGEFVDDVKVLAQLDDEVLNTAGFADKSELVTWLRQELSYATETANFRLAVAEEKRQMTPDLGFQHALTMGPSRRFSAEQLTMLTAQANIMSLPGELDQLEQVGTPEIAEAIKGKLSQASEAGFDVSGFQAQFERLQP